MFLATGLVFQFAAQGALPAPAVAIHGISLQSTDLGSGYTETNVTLGPPGAHPASEAFDARTGNLFVAFGSTDAGSGPSYVDMISGRNDSLEKSIAIGFPGNLGPGGMAVDPSTGDVLVVTAFSDVVAISGSTRAIVRNLTVGTGPISIAFDSASNQVYVANLDSSNITVLNGSDYAPVTSIPASFPFSLTFNPVARQMDVVGLEGFSLYEYVVGINGTNHSTAWGVYPEGLFDETGPDDAAFDPANGDLYVPAGSPANDVLVLNATNGATVGTIPVGTAPYAAVYASAVNEVFVTDSGSETVTAINTTTGIGRPIPVGGSPQGVAYAQILSEVFVTNSDSDTISVVNATNDTVESTVVLGLAAWTVAYVPSLDEVFAAGGDAMRVLSSSLNHSVANVSVGQYPQFIAYDPMSGDLYVTNADDGTVSIVSAQTLRVTSSIDIGGFPIGVAYDSATGQMLVALARANSVAVISGSSDSVTSELTVGAFPVGVLYDAARNETMVTDYDADTLSVIAGAPLHVVATISLPSGSVPSQPTLDPSIAEVFVPDRGTGNVSVVSEDSNRVVQSVYAGGIPFAAVYDPETGLVYVTNPTGDDVIVINPTTETVVGTLPAGNLPFGIACDTRSGSIYVANQMSDSITYYSPILPPSGARSLPTNVITWVLGVSVAVGSLSAIVAAWRARGPARSRFEPDPDSPPPSRKLPPH